jgi:hypothetical protein
MRSFFKLFDYMTENFQLKPWKISSLNIYEVSFALVNLKCNNKRKAILLLGNNVQNKLLKIYLHFCKLVLRLIVP